MFKDLLPPPGIKKGPLDRFLAGGADAQRHVDGRCKRKPDVEPDLSGFSTPPSWRKPRLLLVHFVSVNRRSVVPSDGQSVGLQVDVGYYHFKKKSLLSLTATGRVSLASRCEGV